MVAESQLVLLMDERSYEQLLCWLRWLHCSAARVQELAGVTSLQPIRQLVGGLKKLPVKYCFCVQKKVLELPHVQATADMEFEYSHVKEVVLAGVVRRLVGLLVP